MLSSKWDAKSTRKSKLKMMTALLRTYEVEDGAFDIPKLSSDLGDDICLLIPRIASMLGSDVHKRKHSFRLPIRCLGMLLLTNQGQDLAEASPNIMRTLVQTLGGGEQQDTTLAREQDLVAALIMLRNVCSLSEHLRKSLLHYRAMTLVSSLQQRVHWSDPLQEAARHLLLDLASVDATSARALSCVFRKLLNSPQVYTKHAAVQMWSSILCTKSAVHISLEGWETEALEQLTRLLLCAPLAVQYDVSELIALLFSQVGSRGASGGADEEGGEGRGGEGDSLLQLTRRVGAVLCLRYTVGGHSIVEPPLDWNMKFFPGYVIEAPEVSE